MKKSRFLKIICSVGLCILLIGCNANQRTNANQHKNAKTVEFSPEERELIQNADTAYDISSLLTRTANLDYLQYSECEQADTFLMYFDLLGTDEYFIVNHNDEQYLLFYYIYSDYGAKMTAITKVDRNYNADHLSLSINEKTRSIKQIGCYPDITYAKCIIKLNQEITSLTVNNKDYVPYDGGYIQAGNLKGVVDAELNIIVPIEYEFISEFDAYETDQQYYRMVNERGAGLMDENFQILLHPQYGNIFFVNDNQFVVTKDNQGGLAESEIGIVDRNGNVLHNYIDGFIDGGESFHNDVHQVVFGCMDGEDYLKGVIDDQLNIIIEPQYKAISVFEIGSRNDQFYVVENRSGRFAVIDSSGHQRTDFEKTSVYDVQTKYYQAIRGSLNS